MGLWTISPAKSPSFNPLNHMFTNNSIQINGVFLAGFKVEDATEPSSTVVTAFAPIYDIIQALKIVGIENSWDGATRTWAITTQGAQYNNGTSAATGGQSSDPSSSSSGSENKGSSSSTSATSQPSSGASSVVTTYGLYNKVQLQNSATNDATYWGRMDANYFLAVQTSNSLTNPPPSPPKLLSAQPGQTLYLTAYSDNSNVPPNSTKWFVNSTFASITPDQNGWAIKSGSQTLDAAGASFVASKPGIYTVQAEVGSNYTVPLVITVGLQQLQSTPIQVSAQQSGVQPLPAGTYQIEQTVTDASGTKYTFYQPVSGWIPVSGTAASGVNKVCIQFWNTSDEVLWTYSVPVVGGHFGALLLPPVQGSVQLAVDSHYLTNLTSAINSGQQYSAYVVPYDATGGTDLTQQQIDTLASAKMDYNMSTQFNTIASTLLENSPSIDTGIEAVNNYVSDFMTYDSSELQPGGYRFQDSLETLKTGLGVCEDYAELESSLLRSVGIQTETISGTVEDPTGAVPITSLDKKFGHEWLKVWNGASWIVADPTWASEALDSGYGSISNEFFTNTTSFTSDHVANESEIGTPS